MFLQTFFKIAYQNQFIEKQTQINQKYRKNIGKENIRIKYSRQLIGGKLKIRKVSTHHCQVQKNSS